MKDFSKNKEKLKICNKIVNSMFRFSKPEYTMMGLKKLMDKNRQLMKSTFAYLDTLEINQFI